MSDWRKANRDHLTAAVEVVQARLERQVGGNRDLSALVRQEEEARLALPSPSALMRLDGTFRLSEFEREIVLMVAAAEMRPEVGAVLAEIQRDPLANYPTFAVALACLGDPEWEAVTAEGTLRRFRLIEVADGPSLCGSRLRIPERVLHYLHGIEVEDSALGFVEAAPQRRLPPSHERLAEEASQVWVTAQDDLPTILLHGPGAESVAARIAAELDLRPFVASADQLPDDLGTFIAVWSREAVLRPAALILRIDSPEARERATWLSRRCRFPLILVSRDEAWIEGTRGFAVPHPPVEEAVSVWREVLGPMAGDLNGSLETIADRFRLDTESIRQAGERAVRSGDAWGEARRQARRSLDGLAQRIESRAGWDDLVLPDSCMVTLRQIAAHVRQRSKVYREWGFEARSSRGLAISALFSGASGTGKTLASEVLAGALNLDLYRIDLSQVVSKYIGETEKNLRRIFEAAEGSGAVLLFDEADALFGKRSEVKDSHDRYANLEIAYLLQLMEAYHGLVILTTNLRNTIDPAFLRRIRFVVQFPFPEYEDRRRIWQAAFPLATPLEQVDFDRLASLSLTGGSIRNVALNAAFLAADEDSAVGPEHLKRAARGEYAKLERPYAELEAAL